MKLTKLVISLLLFTQIAFGQNEKKEYKGVASYYNNKYDGRKTCNGEIFKQNKYTAASNKLKMGSYVKVTNLDNDNIVYVKINDKLAVTNKRLIDLAKIAAKELDFIYNGTTKVKIEMVDPTEGQNNILAQNLEDSCKKINQL